MINDIGEVELTEMERINTRKRRRLNNIYFYTNCEFILGSAAHVERLKSIAKNILRYNRKLMSPVLFEALFLWEAYKSYRGLETVGEVMKRFGVRVEPIELKMMLNKFL